LRDRPSFDTMREQMLANAGFIKWLYAQTKVI
jgi:hypothetical protein